MELTPEERLFAAMIRHAIKDALRAKDASIRAEATAFVRWVAPGVAERADLPRVEGNSDRLMNKSNGLPDITAI